MYQYVIRTHLFYLTLALHKNIYLTLLLKLITDLLIISNIICFEYWILIMSYSIKIKLNKSIKGYWATDVAAYCCRTPKSRNRRYRWLVQVWPTVATATRHPPTACCRCWFRHHCEKPFGQQWLYISAGDSSPVYDRWLVSPNRSGWFCRFDRRLERRYWGLLKQNGRTASNSFFVCNRGSPESSGQIVSRGRGGGKRREGGGREEAIHGAYSESLYVIG